MEAMKWSENLFLKINGLLGKNRWLDSFGRAGAEWAIVAMGAWYITACFLVFGETGQIVFCVGILAILILVGWVINIILWLFKKEVRPHLRFPESKYLFWPASSWKSFPSDHAMCAFIIFFCALFLSLPGAWALLILALWVIFGRVYAGVHYPHDVLGGAMVATAISLLYYIFLFNPQMFF